MVQTGRKKVVPEAGLEQEEQRERDTMAGRCSLRQRRRGREGHETLEAISSFFNCFPQFILKFYFAERQV